MTKTGAFCSLLLVFSSYVGGQELRRIDDVSPIGQLSKKMQFSLSAPEGRAGNFSMPEDDLFAFSSQLTLVKRQSCSAGTPCQGGCCAAGNKCVPTNPFGPCCPTSASVCSAGQCCRTSTDCCSTGCCDSPRTCCGGKGCCESNERCCNGLACCKPGDTCCSGGCTAGTCCGSAACDPGKSCCNGLACCTSSQTCCKEGCCLKGKGPCCGDGCCAPGETCCGNGASCCKQGSTCGKDGYCSTSVTINSYTSPTRSPTRKPSETSEIETPDAPTPECTINPAQFTKRMVTTGQCTPQCPPPPPATSIVFSHVTHSTDIFPASVLAATPTLSAVVLDNSRLLRNMCKGMQNLVGKSVQEVVLTRHRGASIRRSNSRAMCKQNNGFSICGFDAALPAQSDGSPLNIPSYLGPDLLKKWYLATECDEFPFASSCEGGDLTSGSSYCLSAWENRWGSWQMRPWNALQAGQRCRVIIDKSWDCSAASVVGGGQ